MTTLKQFISENKDELRKTISRALNHVPAQASCDCPKSGTDHYHHDKRDLDTEALRQWILADEGLYRWARSAGVQI